MEVTDFDQFITARGDGSLDVKLSEEIRRDKESFDVVTVRQPRVSDYKGLNVALYERGDPAETCKVLGRLTDLTPAELQGLLYADFLTLSRAAGRLIQR